MGAVRIAVIAVAALAAILLAFTVRGLLTPKKHLPVAVALAPPQKPMVQVLTAKRDLSVGTRVTIADMEWKDWPAESLNANFITNGAAPAAALKGAGKVAQSAAQATKDLTAPSGPMQDYDGSVVKDAILQGEPIVDRKVIRGGAGGYMAVVLKPGMRAMSIPVNVETGAGGFILPGDRVDVLQSHPGPDGKGFITETLMRNIRVLAIDQKTQPAADSKAIVGAAVVLEVPAADSLVLAHGKAQGEMLLALRSYADMNGGSGSPSKPSSIVRVYRGGQMMENVHR